MKKLIYLLLIILLGLSVKPVVAQVGNLSDWRVPIPVTNSDHRVPLPIPPNGTNEGGMPGALVGISFPDLMKSLPPMPGGGMPGSPPSYLANQLRRTPTTKRVSDADDEHIANLVKKALADFRLCCCCCCTLPPPPPIKKPAPKKKAIVKAPVSAHKKLTKPIKKPLAKAAAVKSKTPAPKVKTRYIVKYRYKYIPYNCDCTPKVVDTAKKRK